MNEILSLAHFHEAHLGEVKKSLGHFFGPKLPPLLPSPTTNTFGPRTQPGRPPPLETHSHSPPALQPRRISTAEAQTCREKGLCYYCDVNFFPDHKCKDPQLFLLDDESEEES
ncbi:hypothetical protein PVK06_048230 [Gossypium arboreum]|uniref:Uncharacterized protein n=1 Tax=Gossypium arboreum TaxID=29729 RepID=A0ABR0MFD5_GOSAR|nr:hypothetical protein PVK06_048230 [Gossypium arboreum]